MTLFLITNLIISILKSIVDHAKCNKSEGDEEKDQTRDRLKGDFIFNADCFEKLFRSLIMTIISFFAVQLRSVVSKNGRD